MLRLLPLVPFIFSASTLFSQKLLFHKNNFKEQFYEVGDVISFRLKNDKTKVTGKILDFEDSVIVFQGYKINPQRISAIYVDKKTRTWFALRYKYKYLLPEIGAGYLLLEWVNTGSVDTGVLKFSGAFIASGVMARFLISDRIKIKRKRRLVIMR
jgi:hypothetical protein